MPEKSIPFGEACRIAGIKPGTVRMWRKRARDRAADAGDDERAILRSEYFEPRDGQVEREGLQFLCIFAQLSAMGLTLRDATECAWRYFIVIDGQDTAREPGEPFKSGKTLLAVARSQDGAVFDARVVNVLPRQTAHEVLFELMLFGHKPGRAVLLVDINAVEARVDAALAGAAEGGR